jgi:uncharacterized protein (TIGR00251 family)
MSLQLEQRGNAVRIPVRAQPRASRSEIVGEHGGALKVRLAAPPVEGAANRELIELLARTLGVPKSAVRVVGGETGRNKVVEVEGVDVARVRADLAPFSGVESRDRG